MKAAYLLLMMALGGWVSPKKSGWNLFWEVPASAALFPVDSLHVVEQSRNHNRALKGDADSAYNLALAHIKHGSERSFFTSSAEKWYLRAKELEHPKTTQTFSEWKKKENEGSILLHDSNGTVNGIGNSLDFIVPIILIDAFF